MGIIFARRPKENTPPQFNAKLMYAIRDFITAHGCTYYDDDIDKGIISNYFRLKNGICVEQQITVRQADAVCTTTLSCPVPADNQQLLIWALSVANDINRHIDNGCFFVDLETGDVRFRSYFSPGNTIYTEDIDMLLGYPKKWFRSMGLTFCHTFTPNLTTGKIVSIISNKRPHLLGGTS